eukprot:jgi/Bigna1/89700/estExt_fgenesh1_pg.C_540023
MISACQALLRFLPCRCSCLLALLLLDLTTTASPSGTAARRAHRAALFGGRSKRVVLGGNIPKRRRFGRRVAAAAKQKVDWDSLPTSRLSDEDPKPRLVLQSLPTPGEDIDLFEGTRAALHELATEEKWKGTKAACASRTHDTYWAHLLLTQFEVADGLHMADLFTYKEIYPGSKVKHFNKIREDSGIDFSEMIFFDDDTWNTDEIEKLGVLCVWCPRGLTTEMWERGLNEFSAMKKEKVGFMGKTVARQQSLF